ncbi:MAG: gamma-glutamyl-gamma-aminobutyrate hydrolase family protein [Phycisphaerales bacterium]
MLRPVIGITLDLSNQRYSARPQCADAVADAGGVPILLPCLADCAPQFLDLCQGIILSGGDDPIMENWGIPTHKQAKPIAHERQAFELALLEVLDAQLERPVLGICLGMQLMGLHRGGMLDQHLPSTLGTADQHWGKREHPIAGSLGQGTVHSHHRQAIIDPGELTVVATAPDGVIEAIQDDHRPFYLGVQWHPERTNDDRLGTGLIRQLVEAAKVASGSWPH